MSFLILEILIKILLNLKMKFLNNNDQKIIDLIEEVDDIINLTDEVAEKLLMLKDEQNYEESLNNEELKKKKKKVLKYFLMNN